jgi:hypothetical protein
LFIFSSFSLIHVALSLLLLANTLRLQRVDRVRRDNCERCWRMSKAS